MACVAYGCTSHSSKKGLAFHRFPQDEKFKQLWIKAVHRENWEPSQYSRICSKHFAESCYRQGKSVRLLCRDAIPTIFEYYPTYIQKESTKLGRDRARERLIASKRGLQSGQADEAPELNRPSASGGSRKIMFPSKRLMNPSFDDTRWRNKVRKVIVNLINTSTRRLKKLRTAQQQCRRLKRKVANLESIISEMKSESLNKERSPQMLGNIE